MATVVAFVISGFCKLEIKPLGPVQLKDNKPVPPVAVEIKFNVEPSQIGLFEWISVIIIAVGSVTSSVPETGPQPFASVTLQA